ncbi:chondroitinase family polysaccharide lyase [Flavobacterium sp. ST-87]|uniref:Chondroitinase family polysaccharide lyase n=1 Tax=Flavobacterium plantiphilum TaxID=3163297 RepID=A0ABW8XPC2_9FLAO
MKKSLLALLCVFALLEVKAQNSTWMYDFGTTTAAPYTSTTYNTSYLPAPTTEGGNAGVRASSSTEGKIELTTTGLAGGSGAELKMTGGATTSGAKFGLAPFSGTTLASFECKINISSGTNGRFLLYFGNGGNFTSGGGINVGQTFAALRFTPASTGVNLDWLINSGGVTYTTTGLAKTTINKNQVYKLKFFMNNSSTNISYTNNGGLYHLPAGTFDIWLDGNKLLINADPGSGTLPQGTIINGMNLLNVGAGSSTPTLYVDDIIYSNFLEEGNTNPAAINSLSTKYRNWLTGENADYSKSQVMERYNRFLSSGLAAMDLSSYDFINPGSVWDFTNSADQSDYAALVEQKLIRLVFLYQIKGPVASPNPNYHHPALKETILTIFNYLKAKGVTPNANFAYEEHSSSEMVATSANGIALRSSAYATSLFLMKEELVNTGEFANHLGALNGLTFFISPEYPYFNFTYPGYNADVVRASVQQRLCYVLAQDQTSSNRAANMDFLKRFINNAMQISNGWAEFIKPDFITFHHQGAYSNSYGVDALHQASILNLILKNTEFELNSTAQNNIKNAVMAYRKFCNDFEMPTALAGRFPANTDVFNDLRPALAYLYQADPIANADAGQEFIRLWDLLPSANIPLQRANTVSINMVNTLGGIQDMAQVLNTNLTPAVKLQQGHFTFPYAGLNIHKYNGWQVSIKGTSKHIWHFENGSSENIYGRYFSAGTMEILALGNPINRQANGLTETGWDWSHLAGTTVAYLPLASLPAKMRLYNGKQFLAHASLGNNGVFSMDYRDANATTDMSAVKTNFFFGDKILCLGSNIKDVNGNNPIHTTLFQTALASSSTPTYVNGNTITGTSYNFTQTGGSAWATDAVGNGYVVVDTSSTNNNIITIQRAVQTSMNNRGLVSGTGNFTTAYIDHGASPDSAAYRYAIVLQGGSMGTQELATNFSNYFNIIEQDSLAHVAKYVPDSIYAYAIFNATKTFNADVVKSVDKPAVVMTKKTESGNKLKISLTNPLNLLSSNENYTYNQITNDPTVFHRTSPIDIVTLTLDGKWFLESPTSNITSTIDGNVTKVFFSTSDGATLETTLVKASLTFKSTSNVTKTTNPGVCTYTAHGNEFDIDVTGNCGNSSISYTLSGATVGSGNHSIENVVFNTGITTVSWTATDLCSTVTNSFNVTVTDAEASIINAIESVSLCYNTNGNYNIPTATATDNCNINTITYQITGATVRNGNDLDASGTFNVGISTIIWTVTDNAGNTNTTTTNVTINSEITGTIADVYAVNPGGTANTIYLGYGPSSLTLTATPVNGTAPYNFSWSNGDTSATTTVSPSTAGTHDYTLTITDALGCSFTVIKQITVIDILCSDGKVKICHSNSNHDKSLCISANGVSAHLAHGCYLGSCVGKILSTNKDIIVSTEQQVNNFKVAFSPNPTKSEFQLCITAVSTETVSINIFDITGRKIKSLNAKSGQIITLGNEFYPGIYLAEITQGMNKQTVKLLKQ